jgi:hypothetical protein
VEAHNIFPNLKTILLLEVTTPFENQLTVKETCAMRDDEPRPVWMSLLIMH